MWDQRPALFDFIRQRQWIEALNRIETFPYEAMLKDSYGNSAFSLACCRFPPLTFIQRLAAACGKSKSESLLTGKTIEGWTPMHLACIYASVDVVKFLIKITPKAAVYALNKRHQTPLQYLCWFHSHHLQALAAGNQDASSLMEHDSQLKGI